jgi:hypothetical protein
MLDSLFFTDTQAKEHLTKQNLLRESTSSVVSIANKVDCMLSGPECVISLSSFSAEQGLGAPIYGNSSYTVCFASGCVLFLLGRENVVKKFILFKTILPDAMAFYAFNLIFFWERQISDCIGIAEFLEKNFSDLIDQIFIRH